MGSLRYAGSGSGWPFSAVVGASFQDCRGVLMREGMVRGVDDRAAGGRQGLDRGQPASGIIGSDGRLDLRLQGGTSQWARLRRVCRQDQHGAEGYHTRRMGL
jgi:hypothetical protein